MAASTALDSFLPDSHPLPHPRPEADGAAELAVLRWVLSLPAGLDPAVAARALLARTNQGGPRQTEQPGLSSRLLELLEEIATYPAERLVRLRTGRRGRRG
jgi:hypothetical protein